MSSRSDYGIDSPGIVAGFLVTGSIALGVSLSLRYFGSRHWVLGLGLAIVGIYLLMAAGSMIWYSKVDKLRIRDRMLAPIPWRGDELVLDVGCGRGLLVIGAAKRLTSGKVFGVDRWLAGALSGNRAQSVLENARREGVEGRVEVKEADIRQLPFADASFDVVLSNFVVHELDTAAEREQMLREMVRVLKPGGRLMLVDFIFTAECVPALRECGLSDVRRERVGSFLSFWLKAFLNFGLVRTCQVSGSKLLAGT